MELIDGLRTTGAVREFDDRPVDEAVLRRVLDTARFGPSGGNQQGWRVVVVQEPSARHALRDLYLSGWYEYMAISAAGLRPWAPITDRDAEAAAAAGASRFAGEGGPFAEHLDRAPVLLVVLVDLRVVAAVDRDLGRYTFVGGASVYPFVWNLLLAARGEGLGGVMTTVAIRAEEELKALVGAPPELAVAAVVALGHPVHQPVRLRRQPVDAFVTVDRIDGRPLGA